MAINLSGLPTVPLRIIFLVMFCLVTWATTTVIWLGQTYLLANYFIVLIGIWCEYDKYSHVPVQLFFFGMIFTLLNDIICLGVTFEGAKFEFGRGSYLNTFNFNATCAIILILIKPVFALFIYKEWTYRINSDDSQGTAPNSSNYERLDQNSGYGAGNQQAPPQYQTPTQPFP